MQKSAPQVLREEPLVMALYAEFMIQILDMRRVKWRLIVEDLNRSIAMPTDPLANNPARQGVQEAKPPRYILLTLVRVSAAS